MSVLKVKDGDQWVGIPSIKGDKGDPPVLTSSKSGKTTTIYSDGTQLAQIQDGADGVSSVTDVQVNESSVVSNGVANVPIAGSNTFGVVKIGDGLRLNSSNKLETGPAGDTAIKAGTDTRAPITCNRQHQSVFYGLAKAAGDSTQAASENEVGTYTDDAKAAIQTMLDVPSTSDIPSVPVTDVQINGMSIVTSGVAVIPLADTTNPGAVIIGAGLTKNASNKLATDAAGSGTIKTGTNVNQPIVPGKQHESVFYGLAKASGDATQSASSNPVGTYTDDAKTSIKSMLGVTDPTVTDVQINGTSILSGGVANVPIASGSSFGVIKVNSTYGIEKNSSDILAVNGANADLIKAGTEARRPITPYRQHESVFYGLAKASGDTTQASSSNAVGTYTSTAKSAIRNMLGIDSVVSIKETVSGSTPSITGTPNVRYVCGEVSTLTITPPANGTIDVIFESGSTATVLTVPNTVKFQSWFDASDLDSNTIYEIMITDGVYGVVMTWES